MGQWGTSEVLMTLPLCCTVSSEICTTCTEAPTCVLACSTSCLQVYNSKSPPGVIRSPQRPEETRGLTRSGGWVACCAGVWHVECARQLPCCHAAMLLARLRTVLARCSTIGCPAACLPTRPPDLPTPQAT